jgi:2-hydroxychromene-2-carboxylate isomerase
MGDLIHIHDLRDRRRRRRRRLVSPPRMPEGCRFYFDLASPFSYLAAERVEALFAAVEWIPARNARLSPGPQLDAAARHALAEDAQRRAAVLRLGLVWPDRWPAPVPAAMRAAAHAVEAGRGGAFALAAGRLAFCGGFRLDEPETLAEAAAAAGLDVDAVWDAADEVVRDAAIEGAATGLLAAGADRLPVIEVAGRRFCGEERLEEAAVAGARLVR